MRPLVQTNDAVPEEIFELQITRKTVELCGEQRDRFRCTRDKGHEGPHEHLGIEGSARWR
jgi:hypothetical protein